MADGIASVAIFCFIKYVDNFTLIETVPKGRAKLR